jgi:transposase-like protein
MGTMLYLLGVSYRGVEDFLTAIGYPLDHTTIYRDVQEAGEEVRKQRRGWLKQVEGIQVVGGDPTSVRCSGTDVVIGVTVDAQEGVVLDIAVLDNQRTDTLYEWLQPILDAVGAQVLTTDDAEGFKEVADRAGVEHQICRRHVTTNVLAFIAEIAEQVWEKPSSVLGNLDVSSEQLLEDLALLEWIMLGHPGHGAKLLKGMYLRYAPAPAPKKGERASIGYRMRNHVLHLWDNWKRLTCYRTLRYSKELEMEATNNVTERAIGWAVKERYRTMRGYKRTRSILNVTGLTAWLLDQPVGYDMSPLFVS